jgi:hypothetical protein
MTTSHFENADYVPAALDLTQGITFYDDDVCKFTGFNAS